MGPKIVLDHVRMYIIDNEDASSIASYTTNGEETQSAQTYYVCALWVSSPLVVYDAIDNASSSRATRTEKY